MAHAIAVESATQLPPHKDKTEHQMPGPLHRPASGRTTAQGRKVEKPGDASPRGPVASPPYAGRQQHTNK